MRTGLRRIARVVTLLFLACLAFVVGLSTFYVYAETAAFLFKPKQPTETTQSLTPQAATLPTFQFAYAPAFPTPQPQQPDYSSNNYPCENCTEDEDFGLCEVISGQYINDNYGYMLTIPDEIRAMQSPPPAPNHGFVARIKSDPQATIYVDGSYDTGTANTLSKATDREINYLSAEHGAGFVLLKRRLTRLGKRTAARFTVQYTDVSTGVTMIEDTVIALKIDSPAEDAIGIVYTLTLRTPIFGYEANRQTFEKILKRWTELDVGGC
jgi:hypothetical protein